MNLDVLNIKGEKKSNITLSDELYSSFDENLFYEVVKMQMANRRAGTASTKTRSEVSGGGAKPWKQKGSGRARAGSSRSPVWRHGGTCFGPKPRDYSYKVPKKVAKAALRSAIAYKISEGKFKLFDLLEIKEPKTRLLTAILKDNSLESALIVAEAKDANLKLATRNLKDFKFVESCGVNVYDILRFESLVMTREAFDKVEETLR